MSTGRHVIWRDDFTHGFRDTGPDAAWAYLPFGPRIGHDAVTRTEHGELVAVSAGTAPDTGEPAFTSTVGQHDPDGYPGTLDHVKWLVYANITSSAGVLGFDVLPDHELSCATRLAGRTYGTTRHPFGDAVRHPLDDVRLASVGVAMQDVATGVAVEFSLTDERVYVYYERLPDERATLGHYASFLYAIPVARREPAQRHHLRISYDAGSGVTRWMLDGSEVYRLARLGHRLDSTRYLIADHGGSEQTVRPRQFACGMGLFNVLDASLHGTGLVRLSTETGFYFDPAHGPPRAERFVDDASLPAGRLFGQGAGLRMSGFEVSREKSRRGHGGPG